MPSLHEIPDALTYKDKRGKNIVTEVIGSSFKYRWYSNNLLDYYGNKRNDKYIIRMIYDSIQVFKDNKGDLRIVGILNNGVVGTWKYSGEIFMPENDVNKCLKKNGGIEPFIPNTLDGVYSPSGNRICYLGKSNEIAMSMMTGKIRLQNIATINNKQNIPVADNNDEDNLSSLCYLGNGRLASAPSDGTVRLWDTIGSKYLTVLKGHKKRVRSLCYLGDGQLASGSLDKTIWIWDINSGKRLRVLEGHKGGVTSLCALEKGFLASASNSEILKTVRVWDIKSGKCVRVLQENMLAFSIISLSYLGKGRLASASWETVRVWDLNATETTPKLLKLIFPRVYGDIRSIQAIPDTNKILILRVPNEYEDPVLNDSFINICDITNLENFPKPNRSAIGHRIQNWLRKKGGRVSRKKRIINKNRNTKKFRGNNNFKS